MTKTIEAKPVREARAEARRMAKKTELTYQQALDKVARDAGAEHWAAFAARHPAVSAQCTPATTVEPSSGKRPEYTFPRFLRSIASGAHGAQEDRMRSSIVLAGAEDAANEGAEDEHGRTTVNQDRARRYMWLEALKHAAVPPAIVLLLGSAYVPTASLMPSGAIPSTMTGFGMGDVFLAAAVAAAFGAALFAACLAIGDQAGMERRRAAAWTALLWLQIAGFAVFLFSGLHMFDDLLERATGMHPYTALTIGTVAMVAGGYVRKSLHTLMVLGAALGPKGDESSLADPQAVLDAIEEERLAEIAERKRNRPPHTPLTPEMARELAGRKNRDGLGIALIVMLGMIALGCVLSLVGAIAMVIYGIDARPIGYVAAALLTPLAIAVVAWSGMSLYRGLALQPVRWRKQMQQHSLVQAHERARRA